MGFMERLLLILIIFGQIIYFLPTIVACLRGHKNQLSIFVLNIFLGWTFIGWVIAIVWSVTYVDKHSKMSFFIKFLMWLEILLIILGFVVVSNLNKKINSNISDTNNTQTASINLTRSKLKTNAGELSAIINKNNLYIGLYLNNNLIYSESDLQFPSGVIAYSGKLGTNDIYMIDMGSFGGNLISCDNYSILSVSKNGSYRLKPNICIDDVSTDISINDSTNCIVKKNYDERPYADQSDYFLTNVFCNDKSKETPLSFYNNIDNIGAEHYKTNAYYENKFKDITMTDIINVAKKDQCYNNDNNILNTSHVCNWGGKYCFMYKYSQHKDNSKEDKMLKTACDNSNI